MNYAFRNNIDDQPDFEAIFKAVNDLIDSGYNAYHYVLYPMNSEIWLLISNNSGYDEKKAMEIWKELMGY